MPDAERVRLQRAYQLGIFRTLLVSSVIIIALGVLAVAALLANNRARKAELVARQAEVIARHQLFVADMNLAQRAFEEGNIPRTLQILEAHRARTEESTRFEWRYLWGKCHRESAFLQGTGNTDDKISAIQFVQNTGHVRMLRAKDMTVSDWGTHQNTVKTQLAGVSGDLSVFRRAALSPQGDRIARCLADSCVVTEAATGKDVFSLKTDSAKTWVEAVAFSPNSHWLAVSDTTDKVSVWNLQSQKRIHNLASPAFVLCFSPNCQLLATGNADGSVHIWEMKSGKEKWKLSGSWGIVHALRFSPDNKFLAVGARDGIIRLLDTESGHVVYSGKGHTALITGIEFTTKGNPFVTSSADQTVRLWDRKRSSAIRTLKGSTAAIDALALSEDGQWLATGNRNGDAAVWKIATQDETSSPALLSKPLHAIRILPPNGHLCTAIRQK